MIRCIQCGKNPASAALSLCPSCVRLYPDRGKLPLLHGPSRAKFNLPAQPPRSTDGFRCRQCANACCMGEGEAGYCGMRSVKGGRLVEKAPEGSALAHTYYDRLPTNCCASWFCRGSSEDGYSLAVFFYGCSFDCLFCQNWSHRCLENAPVISIDELVSEALSPHVRCVCFFGGSPEPQLPFALEAAERILSGSGCRKHICWEWNGSGSEELVERAARISAMSGGTVKFDLKAHHPGISLALCGVDNRKAFENFRMVGETFSDKDLLTATTLLVPYYVDSEEVEKIAAFISGVNTDIPYSLLVFHPDFVLDDLPVTPKGQARACFDAARRFLGRVNIGNRELLPGSL